MARVTVKDLAADMAATNGRIDELAGAVGKLLSVIEGQQQPAPATPATPAPAPTTAPTASAVPTLDELPADVAAAAKALMAAAHAHGLLATSQSGKSILLRAKDKRRKGGIWFTVGQYI